MTIASALFCLGFALLTALGLFALGLVLAASFFAIIAAGKDIICSCIRVSSFFGKIWHGFGPTGRQFIACWIGLALCGVLAVGTQFFPRNTPIGLPWDGFDLLGFALCLPAAVQIAERMNSKRGTDF